MEQLLAKLVERLRKALGGDLISVVVYGSYASEGQFDRAYSDINVLCVLREVTASQLGAVNAVFQWWSTHARPVPLLLGEKELLASADCFAMEFHDMRNHRKVLYGSDPIGSLPIDDRFYRAQVEYELRTRLIRLRQKAAAVLADKKLLGRLMIDSVSTFCVLLRHALIVAGVPPAASRRAALALAQTHFDMDPSPFLQLLDARESGASPDVRSGALFADYLAQIGRLIDTVDRLGGEA